MDERGLSPGVSKGLEAYYKHPPPFSDEELTKIEHIGVGPEHTPRGIERLTGLWSITYMGCEVVDLSVLQHCTGIGSVKAWSSNLTTLAPLPTVAPLLTILDIRVCHVRDLSPLLELPKLMSARLAGNPLDEVSFREIYPDLVRRGIVNARVDGATIQEPEWELMQEFVALGLRLSAYRVNERTRIAAPGHIVHANPEGSGIAISPRQARRILAENPGLDEKQFLELASEVRYRAEGYKE